MKDITQSSTLFGSNALDILLDEGVRAFQSIPLVSLSGQLLGIMSVYFSQIHTLAEREQIFIDILVRQAAEVIKRKLVEEELCEIQEDLDSTQAVGNIGNWRLDSLKNELKWSNENHRIFGILKGTPLTYETFLSAVHPDDREYVDKKWKAGFAGEPLYDLEHRIIVNGKIKWVHQKARLEFNKSGTLIGGFGITQDITERKKVEEALRQSEQRIRLKLDTVLSPASEIANLELAEIIDVQVIQSLMNDFYTLAHIPMSIDDLKDNVLVGVGWQDICTKFHRVHPETCKSCVESGTKLSVGVPPGEFKLYKCRNNMWHIATPIMVGGKHVGNIFSGQFFFENELQDYEFFRFQARKYGFNEEEYIAALEKVPRLNRGAVNTGMSFFIKLANMISQLGYSNIKLAQSLAEHNALMEALGESEKRYRMLFDHSTDAIILSDPRNSGKILSVNPAACRMLGWVEGELIGKGRDVMFDPEDPMVSHVLDELIRSGSAKAQLIYRRKDGTTFPGEMSTTLFTDSNEEPRVVIIIRDITERKHIEDKLAFERSQLLSIFDGINDVVYVTDPYTSEVLYANKAMKEKFGGELLGGICYQEFQHRDSPCDFCTNPIILKEKGKPYFWEYYNPTVDRYFMIMDRIITWPDGRDVRFEIAKDITERKRAEEALRLSYIYNRSLIEASLDPLVTIGPDGKITDVNGATEQITGYSRNELIGTDFSDYFTEPEKARQGYQQVFTDGKVWDYSLEIQHKDGHITPVLYNASVYRDENGEVGVFAAARDITESKKAEETLKKIHENLEKLVKERTAELEKAYKFLKESEKSLAEAQKMAHIGNWEWNIATDEAHWSDELYRIFGLNPQEAPVGQNELFKYIHPDDRDYANKTFKEGSKGEQTSVDIRIILDNGEERTIHVQTETIFDEDNIPIRVKGITQDITERKKAEEKSEYLANIVESSSDSVITLSLEGIVTSWNKGAEQIYGYPAEEILGKNSSIVEPDNLKGEIKRFSEKIKKGEQIQHYETLREKKDGTIVNISATLSPVFNASGNLVAISGIARDITERIKAEEALAKIDKLRIKEIHHRIKNNLQVISSLLDLQAEMFDDEKVRWAFKEGQNRVVSMSLIHEELYKGEGADTLNFSEYLQKLAENLFQTYSLRSKSIQLLMDLEKDAFFDMDISVPLGIIVNELVSNSLKHAFTEGEKGEIRIQLCREKKGDEMHKSLFSLIVSDNGRGVPENIELENLESLGLQLVSALVGQLDGKIEIKRDSGTEFRIIFSAAEGS